MLSVAEMKNISMSIHSPLSQDVNQWWYSARTWSGRVKKVQTNVTYRVHIAFSRGPEIFIGTRCLARIERVKRYIIFRSLSLSLSVCLSISVSLSLPFYWFFVYSSSLDTTSIETTIRNIDRARRFIVSSLLLLLLFLWKFSPLCPCSMAR